VETSVFDGGKTDPVTQSLLDKYVVCEEVRGETFSSLSHRLGLSHISFLQIDTEGYDWQVLKQIVSCNYQPVAIKIEHKHMPEADLQHTISYFEGNKYAYRVFDHDILAVKSVW
jgi:hypothetical protein